MKKAVFAFAISLLPASIFADVQINFNATGSASFQSSNDSEEEHWFEGDEYDGSSIMSFEYQWSSTNGERVLQYRQVNFFPLTGAWVFGPWMIKEHHYHSSCIIHRAHKYYHHKHPAPQWKREYSRVDHKHIYHYGHQPVHHKPHIHRTPVELQPQAYYFHHLKKEHSKPNCQINEEKCHNPFNNHNKHSYKSFKNAEHTENHQPVRIAHRDRNR